MASLRRETKANYVIHDMIQAETTDREDHTFCGIMFPVKCKDILPVDHVIINSVAVRGALGPLTVWVTKDENLNGEISMSRKNWTKVYERVHSPSFVGYSELDLSSNPILLSPGQVRGIYIHSTRRGDEAIVYDNKVKTKTHDDGFITVLPGRAHVSERVFGSVPIWGWGSAWRDNREFVGQIKYGACYRLWNPSENLSFGGNFRCAARSLFMCQRRAESPFSKLPDDAIYYILNMMRWDWVNDTSAGMVRDQKEARRNRRRQMIADMEAAEATGMAEAAPAPDPGDDAEVGVDEDSDEVANADEEEEVNEDDDMDEDSVADDVDTGSLDSAVSDEYAWGDHVSSRNAFVYNDDDSLSDESDEGDGVAGGSQVQHRMQLRARRSILSFLRAH